jgi:hypothetical protein
MKRVLVVTLVALTLAPAAAAKGWPLFERTTARPGDTVVVSSGWNDHPHGLVLYFMPLAQSPRFWRTYQALFPNYGPPPKVPGAIRLGRMRAHGRAASLSFRVPRVTPGRYVLGVWCVPCGTHWTSALPNYQPTPLGILRVRRA